MNNTKQRIIIALCILFAILIIGAIFYSTHNVKENFEEKQKTDTSSKPTKSTKTNKESTDTDTESTNTDTDSTTNQSTKELKLSNREVEIFNDLLSNKLTDVNIDSLIQSGVLTENMIERFLSKITKESFALPTPLINNENKSKDPKIIEAFTGFTSLTPMYATATTPVTNQIHSKYN